MLLFKSKEYKEGWRAGRKGTDKLDNPYSCDASRHNLKHGMGASPWWETNYKPFIDWNMGRRDALQPEIDECLNRLFGDN